MLALLWKCAMFEVPKAFLLSSFSYKSSCRWPPVQLPHKIEKKKTPFLAISKPYKLINQYVNFLISWIYAT
jgi:hypothetical protein